MQHAEYFRRQAARCHRLARRCFDLDTAKALNAIGDELLEKAREIETGSSVVGDAGGRGPMAA